MKTACRAVLAVLAGFVGIRRRDRAEADMRDIRPLHIVAAGLLAVAAFIAILLFVVKSVVQA